MRPLIYFRNFETMHEFIKNEKIQFKKKNSLKYELPVLLVQVQNQKTHPGHEKYFLFQLNFNNQIDQFFLTCLPLLT